MVNHPNRSKRSKIDDGHTTVRVVHSPDEGGYYAVKSIYRAATDNFAEWTSPGIEPVEEDLQLALRLGTVKWEPR